MKTLETGQDKIQKICDKLRRDTLEPSLQEAERVVQAAKLKAEEIVAEAEKECEQLAKNAKMRIDLERDVFESSLRQSAKQAVEALRQEIEHRLFNENLPAVLDKNLSNPEVIAKLINAIVNALEKDGINSDLNVLIPRTVSVAEVNALVLDAVKNKMRDHSAVLGSFDGGVQIKLEGRRMTVDISDNVIKELLSAYARKDFRELIFSA